MKTFGIIFFVLATRWFISDGQTAEEHINIKNLSYKVSYDKMYSFNVDVYRKGNNVRVIYSVLDSNTAKSIYDSLVKNYSIRAFYTSTDSIVLSKGLYKKDSISISLASDTGYRNLLDSCFVNNAFEFENNRPDLVHTGGAYYLFTFEEDGMVVRKVTTISPQENDYPFLSRLIAKSFDLSQPNLDGFLNPDNTNGRYSRRY